MYYAFATKDAILKGPESFEGLKLKGVEPVFSFDHLQEFLKTGKMDTVSRQRI